MDNFKTREKWPWTLITIFIVGITSIGILLELAHISYKQWVDFSCADTLTDLQVMTTSMHRWFEEGLFDNTSVDVNNIWQEFDRCTGLIDTLLYGGTSADHANLPPPQELKAQPEVETHKSLPVSLKTIAIKRYEIPEDMDVTSNLDKKFKEISMEFQEKISDLEELLEKNQMSNDAMWKDLFIIIVFLWAFVIVASTIGLWSLAEKRRKIATALHKAHSAFHSQAEELAKHREHFIALVEEGTAALTNAHNALQKQIVEREKAVEALQESKNMFEQLSQEFYTVLDAIPDFLVLLSPDLTIQWGNKNVMLALGQGATKLTDQSCWCLWNNGSAHRDGCLAAKTFSTGQAESMQVLKPDGRIWDIRTSPIMDEQGHVKNVIEISRDVTEQVTMQDAAARLAHLASLGKLAAGVAHEINNPINGIINYAQILVDDAKGGEEEADIAGRIVKEGNRIATMVASLLSFAHAQGTEKALVSLHAILSDTLALVSRQLEKDGIILHVQVDTALPQVIAHDQQIEQVFLDIIHNARYALNLKYPGEDAGKILEILGAQVRIDGSPHIQVTFHDHGVGIPAGILPQVIDPFFSTKPRGLGTGLGLSISHDIITDHGGRLVIESVESAFTKVHVVLPSGG